MYENIPVKYNTTHDIFFFSSLVNNYGRIDVNTSAAAPKCHSVMQLQRQQWNILYIVPVGVCTNVFFFFLWGYWYLANFFFFPKILFGLPFRSAHSSVDFIGQISRRHFRWQRQTSERRLLFSSPPPSTSSRRAMQKVPVALEKSLGLFFSYLSNSCYLGSRNGCMCSC